MTERLLESHRIALAGNFFMIFATIFFFVKFTAPIMKGNYNGVRVNREIGARRGYKVTLGGGNYSLRKRRLDASLFL